MKLQGNERFTKKKHKLKETLNIFFSTIIFIYNYNYKNKRNQ
jgi:hypothetical protein